jgi:excinuclease ABC subunit C
MTASSGIRPFDYENFLKNLTQQPGVYQMYDVKGAILYVGKAKNLKKRVSSYFRKSGLSPKTQALVQRIVAVEVTLTPSEAQALVLEHNLIKEQRPPYNILLRDDKSYPYIFLSDAEPYPRIALHRGSKKKSGRYFGPFPNVGAVRESLNFLQKTFRVRQCEDSVYQNRTRPCLQYQIGRCTGPCVGLVSEEDYAEDLRHTEMFLEGNSEKLHEELVAAMDKASANLDFEKAAAYRDQITALRQVQAQQLIETGQSSADVIACAVEGGLVCVHILFIRKGRILGSKSYFPKESLGEPESEVLSAFLPQLYLGSRASDVPPEVIVSHPLDDAEVISQAVQAETGRQLAIHFNVRSHRTKWVAMALDTARQNLRARVNSRQTLIQRYDGLQEALNLSELPSRIECFDISHSSGERTVASCVVFDLNGPVKSDYRRFNIDGIAAGDDYAAMKQALMRRYTRLQKEEKKMPDLLLIDGGKGQVAQARAVLEELGVNSVALFGVAKGTTRKPGFEVLIRPDGSSLTLNSDSSALHLIQQIRDEAHRFAITGHKQRRDKRRRTSTLEDIPGVGPKRRRELLRHFGGLQEVMRASVDDLAKVPSISKKMAQEVYSSLHSE